MSMNKGENYVNRKANTHTNKKLVDYNHQCRYKCNTNTPEDIRKEILGNRLLRITGCIK